MLVYFDVKNVIPTIRCYWFLHLQFIHTSSTAVQASVNCASFQWVITFSFHSDIPRIYILNSWFMVCESSVKAYTSPKFCNESDLQFCCEIRDILADRVLIKKLKKIPFDMSDTWQHKAFFHATFQKCPAKLYYCYLKQSLSSTDNAHGT